MAQQIQICDVKPNLVTLPHCKNTINVQHLQHGTVFVRPRDLQLEGNWMKQDTFIELLESFKFKVSGKCQLRRGEGPYVGHFVVGLSKDHNMGKLKIKKSPPEEEFEEDLTGHSSGMMIPIAMGICDDEYVQFSLTSAEHHWKLQKGLIIYGVTFTPVKMNN
ncbi:hypothetical protein POM88_052063 [Heracleum sosnowskyi]|uniref:Uncharacterized protein n=1 Tax=Heracleum sosnowskyi TaxID=360622 RepID=A0AAD8GTD4_9APIA|nr:hypothetical protein POM88_052063 [Heracleum sosnowskyi]